MKIFNVTHSYSPYTTLSIENLIMNDEDFVNDDVLLIYQHSNAIIIGRNQNAREEINREYVKEHNIQLARRRSGGGAVYHDLGNINFSFITKYDKKGNFSYSKFLEPIIAYLNSLGLNAEFHGRNDLLVNGCKVSGNAQYVQNNRIVSHGTILYNVDLTKLSNALNPSKIKFESKGIKSVRARVTNIFDELSNDNKMSSSEFINNLILYFIEHFNGELLEVPLTKYASKLAIMEQEAQNEDWIFNKSANFTFSNINKFSGGILSIKGIAENGKIQQIVFEGDFLSKRDVSEIEPMFVDVELNEQAILKVLDNINFEEYFGTLEKDEIVKLLLG